MKAKPNVSAFLEGGAAAAAESRAPIQKDVRISKTIRISQNLDFRLKTEALRQTMETSTKVTESDIIEAALFKYLSM